MCGIVGYIGKGNALPIMIGGIEIAPCRKRICVLVRYGQDDASLPYFFEERGAKGITCDHQSNLFTIQ